jgi:energy-coupling factor transport system ATP-binding protein
MACYFGIQDWFHKDVATLSGGQKQLLNLASIMAMQPEVLILDEPTSQLDPIAATDLLNTVRKINLELGTTVIITEHRLEEVFHAADRVVLMEKGRIIACDSPRNIGEKLGSTDSDLFCTLPSTMQIRYRVGGNLPYPLTVREGRQWLTDTFKNVEIKYDSIDTAMPAEETENPVLELKEVWFRYEKDMPDVLKGVNLKLKEAKIHAIVGGNGTGKSTSLKAICGICKPYRGKVKIFGKDIAKYKSAELFENCLAMLPQDPKSLFVKKTVQEDLEEMFSGKKLTKEEIAQKVADVAKLCRIEHFLNSHPYDLSGGEQQRAALAKVLLCNPKILLLDEPTKAIDNSFKAKFAEILKDLTAKGVTVLMVSHDVEFCAKTADEVSMFFDGGITTTNTPNRFFSQNSFYTTAANRMSRHIFKNAVNNEDVIELCKKNLTQTN